jgi:hypothetical protein
MKIIRIENFKKYKLKQIQILTNGNLNMKILEIVNFKKFKA